MHISDLLKEYTDFSSLANKRLTAVRNAGDIRLLALYLHNPLLPSVTDKQIVDYLTEMETLGWEHNGVCKKALAFRTFWKWLNMKNYPTFNYNCIPLMKKDWKQKRIATEEDYKKVLEVIPKEGRYSLIRDAALIRLLWDTGARVGELVSINHKDLDLTNMSCQIKTEKSRGKKPFRKIFWTKETNEYLKSWLKKRESMEMKIALKDPEALFIGSNNTFSGIRLHIQTISILLRKYCQMAKIQTMNPHSFRHRFGHELAKKGANNSVISSLMGHSQLSSSYIYTELTDNENEKMYRQLNGQ